MAKKINNVVIPNKYKYELLKPIYENNNERLLKFDLIDKNFPLYYDSSKLAKAVAKSI